MSFDPTTNTPTFAFGGMLPDARFRVTLVGSGISGPSGVPMHSRHGFDFVFLNADANGDGVVDLADFSTLAANFGQSKRDFTQGEFTYDAVVDLADFGVLASRFGRTLAAAAATALFARMPIPGGRDRGQPHPLLQELT